MSSNKNEERKRKWILLTKSERNLIVQDELLSWDSTTKVFSFPASGGFGLSLVNVSGYFTVFHQIIYMFFT